MRETGWVVCLGCVIFFVSGVDFFFWRVLDGVYFVLFVMFLIWGGLRLSRDSDVEWMFYLGLGDLGGGGGGFFWILWLSLGGVFFVWGGGGVGCEVYIG